MLASTNQVPGTSEETNHNLACLWKIETKMDKVILGYTRTTGKHAIAIVIELCVFGALKHEQKTELA